MILVEDLDEAAHVRPLEMVRQVDIHVDPRHGMLFFFTAIHNDNRIADVLDPDLVDGNITGVVLLLQIRHFAHNGSNLDSVFDGIIAARLGKTLEPQLTRVTAAAGKTFRGWIVAGVGQAIIDAERHPLPDRFRLA